jgi:hypothetical protein
MMPTVVFQFTSKLSLFRKTGKALSISFWCTRKSFDNMIEHYKLHTGFYKD